MIKDFMRLYKILLLSNILIFSCFVQASKIFSDDDIVKGFISDGRYMDAFQYIKNTEDAEYEIYNIVSEPIIPHHEEFKGTVDRFVTAQDQIELIWKFRATPKQKSIIYSSFFGVPGEHYLELKKYASMKNIQENQAIKLNNEKHNLLQKNRKHKEECCSIF